MKSLQEWQAIIRKEKRFVGIKPYSHNIVSIALNAIAKDQRQPMPRYDDFD